MEFGLGEDITLLRESVRDFGTREIAPHAAAWDEAEALPPELPAKLGELGLLGLCVPERSGGAELGMVAAVSLLEELASFDGSVALTVASHNFLAVGHLLRRADPVLLEELLPPMASGRALGGWAAAEPGVGSDLAALRTAARRDGDTWLLDGDKAYVLQGSTAQHLIVLATADASARREGLMTFVVDRDAPGLEVIERVETLGMRAADVADVRLRSVRVPLSRALASKDTWADVQAVLDDHRIAVAAIACGVARAAMRSARDYALEREQFGHPIAQYQAIQWKLADMATDIEAAWLMTLEAAWRREQGLPCREAAARAKLFAAPRAVRACSEALQIHGGYGYTREFPVERYLRNARVAALIDGTTEMQRIAIAHGIETRFAT